MINRKMTAWGIHPVIGYLLGLAAFIGFSLLLFERTELAPLIYILAAISLVFGLSETRRNEFIMNVFGPDRYHWIRILENNLATLPFVLLLVIKLLFIHASMVAALSTFLALTRIQSSSGITIPTPFYKRPFEFATGFRGTFIAFLLAYFLVVMAIASENFNIGIFSLILVFLVCYSYYFNPEGVFYVWIFNVGPGIFLWKKIATAFLYSSMLALPVLLTLIIFYPEKSLVTAVFFALGLIYLATVILAKYASYPDQVSLPQFVILALSVWFPPLLLAVIPYFYLRSEKKLQRILS